MTYRIPTACGVYTAESYLEAKAFIDKNAGIVPANDNEEIRA